MSRHARRDTSGNQDGERPGGYVPPADDDTIMADYGTPGRWPQDDLTSQEPGDSGDFPRGRRHARQDGRTPDQARSPERSQAPERTRAPGRGGQPAEPPRRSPERGDARPDPYAWAPGDAGGASSYGNGTPGNGNGAADYGNGAADYGNGAADYGNRAADYRSGAASYGAGPDGRRGGGDDLDAPPGYGAALPGYDTPPGFGQDVPGYANEVPGYANEVPGYANEVPGYANEVPSYGNRQPEYGSAPSGYGNGAPLTRRSRLAPGPPWEDDAVSGRPWEGDTASGPLPPLPPPSLPGSGHPSGPLPPLPPSELAWRQSLADPLLAEPGPDLGTRDRYSDSTYMDSAVTEQAGYQAYGDDPRDRRAGVAQEARGYPDAGGRYGDVEEPQVRVEDEDEDSLLPGLDDSRSARRRADSASGRGSSSRKRRKRGRRALLAAGMVLLLVVLTGAGAGYIYLKKYVIPPDFSGPGAGSVVVQIKPGDTATMVGQSLTGIGVVDSARAFALAAKDSTQGRALEPGYYRLRKHMKASLAFALLLKPSSRIQNKITIPEGFRLSQIVATLGKETGNLKGYQAAAANTGALGLPSFAKGNPEGYLFPATYEVQPNTPPLTVLKSMVARFDQEATSIGLPAAAARAQLNQGDVITAASLIQAEGKRPQDLAKIARVIYNRLNMTPPMPLQLDTTVLYAMHSFAGDVTIKQTQFKSPYNTYLHPGLPPGPIDSPGDAAIQAALHPAAGNWTYFLTVNPKTGLTLFTNSFTTFQTFIADLARNTGNG